MKQYAEIISLGIEILWEIIILLNNKTVKAVAYEHIQWFGYL